MPILKPVDARTPAVDPRLARTLWQWLALGAIAMLLVPAARGPVYLLGNMPFWLVLAPGIALVTLYRHALAAAWRARLVRATPRRRRRFGGVRSPFPSRLIQARRTPGGKGALTPVFSRGRPGACAPAAAGTLP